MISPIFKKITSTYGLALVLLLSLNTAFQVDAEEVTVHITPYHPFFVGRMKRPGSCKGFPTEQYFETVKNQCLIREALDKGYLSFVLAKVYASNLPLQLALIPLIESHYNETAISPKGAGGLWQLMPVTAMELGISSKDRFDLNAGTSAALKHLKNLYAEFGNWHLAIAAYNCGSQRVKKALSRSHATQTGLKLPQETKAYIKQFRELEEVFALR